MQGLWYGDKRDRVKWGALVHLAKWKKINCIVQVAYFRHGPDLQLQINRGDIQIEVGLPVEVWNHFSDLIHIKGLEKTTCLNIKVLNQEFKPKSRRDYVKNIILEFRNIKRQKIVFLDPDTGIAPTTAKPEHVTKKDMEKIWEGLSEGDLLVIYQHADRTRKWLPDRKEKMSHSCGGANVGTITGLGIASDVAMLWCCKTSMFKPEKTALVNLEPTRPARMKKVPRLCAHQCGELTKGGYFYVGHDAKLKSIFLKISRGKMSKKELDKIVRKMYEIWEIDKSRPLKDIAMDVLG